MPDLTIPPSSTLGLTPRATRPTPLSEEAELEQFITAHGLRADLEKAIAISRESFPAGSTVAIRLWHSPEEEDTRAVVHVRTRAAVAEAVRCHQQLIERWTRELPLHAQDLIASTFCPI
jgi:hypothetical protein